MANVQIILDGVDNASGVINGVGGAINEMATGALRYLGELAVKGFGELTSAIGDFVKDAMEAEKLTARLDAVIKSSGKDMGFTTEIVNSLADQFKDMAGGSDEAVKAIEEMALRMGTVTADQMPGFIQTTLDLAAATGTDAATAARTLAQAYDDPASAMARFGKLGIRFDAALQTQIKDLMKAGKTGDAYNLMIKRLGEATAGAAAGQMNTLSGQFAIWKEHLLDAGKGIGEKLIPGMETLMSTYITPLIPQIEKLADGFGTLLASGLQTFIDMLGNVNNPLGALAYNLDIFWRSITTMGVDPINALQTLFLNLWRDISPMVETFITNFKDWIVQQAPIIAAAAVQWATGLWSWIQTEANVISERAAPYIVAFKQWIVDQAPIIKTQVLEWGTALLSWANTTGADIATAALPYITAVKQWITDQGPGVAEKAGEWVGKIVAWLIDPGIKTVIAGFTALIAGVFGNKYDDSPAFAQGKIFAAAFAEGFKTGVGDIGKNIWHYIFEPATTTEAKSSEQGVKDIFANLYKSLGLIPSTDYSDVGTRLGGALVGGLVNGVTIHDSEWTQAIQAAAHKPETILSDTWQSHSPAQTFVPMGASIIEGLIQGVNALIPVLTGRLTQFASQLFMETQIAFAAQNWNSIGRFIMDGIGQGIKDRMTSVANQAVATARAIIAKMKEELDINSPSGVMREIGVNMMAGMAQGITRGAAMVDNATSNVSNQTINNWNVNVSQSQSSGNLVADLALARVLAGA